MAGTMRALAVPALCLAGITANESCSKVIRYPDIDRRDMGLAAVSGVRNDNG